MKLRFTKMEGCGNDYIYFDCFEQAIEAPERLAVEVSDRHFGVGGDGIILIEPPTATGNRVRADGRMRMFNLDGSEGRMCGNGVRCVGKYLYDSGIARKEQITVETRSGVKTLTVTGTKAGRATALRVDMGAAVLEPRRVPVLLDGDRVVGRKALVGGELWAITAVSMGNPHCVVFVDETDSLDLPRLGPGFEHSPLFPEGVNTEFVRVIDRQTLQMRVWERGSGETLACGTGACAAAVAAVENGLCTRGGPTRVRLAGGDLVIEYTPDRVLLTGPARRVFTGEWEWDPA